MAGGIAVVGPARNSSSVRGGESVLDEEVGPNLVPP